MPSARRRLLRKMWCCQNSCSSSPDRNENGRREAGHDVASAARRDRLTWLRLSRCKLGRLAHLTASSTSSLSSAFFGSRDEEKGRLLSLPTTMMPLARSTTSTFSMVKKGNG